MTPDQARWARIHSMFNQVVDLPPPDREAFLDENCANDAAQLANHDNHPAA